MENLPFHEKELVSSKMGKDDRYRRIERFEREEYSILINSQLDFLCSG